MRWVVGAAVLLVAALSAVGVALVLASAGEGRSSMLAALHDGRTTRIVRIDRATLKPKDHPALTLKGQFAQPLYSPDRRAAALGGNSCLSGSDAGTIEIIDPASIRRKASIPVGRPYENARVVAWPARNRLAAVTLTADANHRYFTTVVVVDPQDGQRIAKARFRESDALPGSETRSGRVPFLLTARTRLAPPRVLVVSMNGRIKTVTLAPMRAGIDRDGAIHFPGFAVDPAGERAFVLGAGEPVAIVDLRTLVVRYRKVDGLAAGRLPAPPRTAGKNPGRDQRRAAAWLGAGMIAVSGADSYAMSDFRPPPWVLASFTPAGLKILDTRRWRFRTLDRRPSSFEWLLGRLVAYARARNARARRAPDETLVAFDRSGRLVYKIRGNPNTYWDTFDGRIFLYDGRARRNEARDARDGRSFGQVPGERLRGLISC